MSQVSEADRMALSAGRLLPHPRHHVRCRKEKEMEYKFTTDNFETEVLGSDIPVLVDFYADWCNPCRMMAPVVAKLAQKYRVSSIPCFIVFKDGKPAETFVGAMSGSELKRKVEQAAGL